MFGDANRHRVDFDLLEHLRLAVGKNDGMAAIGASVQCVGLEMVDRVRWNQRSRVLFVAGLPAAFALLAVLGGRFGRCDDVARWRFGRGRRVFLGRCQLLLELFDLFTEPAVLLVQRTVFVGKLRNFPFQARVALRNFGQPFSPSRPDGRRRVCVCAVGAFPAFSWCGTLPAPRGRGKGNLHVGRRPCTVRTQRAARACAWGSRPATPAPGRLDGPFWEIWAPALAIDLFRA